MATCTIQLEDKNTNTDFSFAEVLQEKENKIAQIKRLAKEKDAVILAHNYQLPEVQACADFIGDSLQLARRAQQVEEQNIILCGVHFMAESAKIIAPEKNVFIPDLKAGCSLADSITEEELINWKKKYPKAKVVMYANTSAKIKALTDFCCTSSNAVQVVEHVYKEYGDDTEILFGPDMWLGAFVEKTIGKKMHVWSGECHVHAGIRPNDILNTLQKNKDAEFLIHPECGCSTQVLEYVASKEIPKDNVHILSTGQMMDHIEKSPEAKYVVATEIGMLHPLQKKAPHAQLIPANPCAECVFMKMINLNNLQANLESLQSKEEASYAVYVEEETRRAALLSIERMVAIG